MPYYIYRIRDGHPLDPNRFEQVEAHDKYPQAKTRVRELRDDPGCEGSLRILHAENPLQAEELLITPRERVEYGDD